MSMKRYVVIVPVVRQVRVEVDAPSARDALTKALLTAPNSAWVMGSVRWSEARTYPVKEDKP